MPTIITAGDAVSNATSYGSGNDGALSLVVGPAGGKITALTIDAQGRVTMPLSVVAFSAFQSVSQAISLSTATKIQFQTKEFDYGNYFDATTNFRYTPLIAGLYQVSGGIEVLSQLTSIEVYLHKNGIRFKSLSRYNSNVSASGYGSALIYMNGTTDYLEIFTIIANTQSLVATASATYVQAILIAKA